MIENLPFEIFTVFIGLTALLVAIGIVKQTPALIVFAGMFLLMWTVVIDSIDMGAIPESSTTIGDTTTYVMEPNTYQFTEWPKTIFSLFSVVLMLIGALLTKIGADNL